MQTLPIKPSKLRLGKLLLPASLMMILSACHMLIPPKKTPAKLLEKTRSSIITNGRVSAATQSILVSAGYTQESCMADFEACVDDVRSIFSSKCPIVYNCLYLVSCIIHMLTISSPKMRVASNLPGRPLILLYQCTHQ